MGCLAYVPSGGVFGDIRHLFPKKIKHSGSGKFLYRNPDGTMRDDDIRLNWCKNSESGGPGYEYKLPYSSFTGLCMGVALADFAKTCIAGVHLRGVPDKPFGKALIVLQDDI